MATTTNFGWTTPNDTDLVKNGAAAIRTLGSAVDTSLAQLKGGTTGQVLSKTSNTDMAFTWVAQDDSNAIQNALLTTTGDTIYASSASTPARLAIGSSGQTLTVVAGVPSWAASATSVLTTTGDLLYASAANTLARRAIGTTGQVLTVSGGLPTWATPASSTPTFVGCSLEKASSTQSINNATTTAITFDSEILDTDGFHSTVSNTSRITIPTGKAGKYLFTLTTSFAANATGVRSQRLYKNGNNVVLTNVSPAIAGEYIVFNANYVVDAAVGDYFEVFAEQNSGGALNLNKSTSSNGLGCYFGCTLIGA